MQTDLDMLAARFQHLEQDNLILHAEIALERSKNQRERRRLRIQAALAFIAFLAAVFALPANRAAIAQGYGVTLASLNTRLTAVEAKTHYLSVDTIAKSSTFSGCNVFVNNGGGTTDTSVTNAAGAGLGNVTIGYNKLRNDPNSADLRTGSHNLIVGNLQNYSSYGGVVFGYENSSLNAYATVTAGESNTASGQVSSVSGGFINKANGAASSVSGGNHNTANGFTASVSAGFYNLAGGDYSSVSGGDNNNASGGIASVSGGGANTASGIHSSVSGGVYNQASGQWSSVSGGGDQTFAGGVHQSHDYGWSAGGTVAGKYFSP